MKIAFLLGIFPKLSETFILTQICGMVARGHDVTVYALDTSGEQKHHKEVDDYDLLSKTSYPDPLPASRLGQVAALRRQLAALSKATAVPTRKLLKGTFPPSAEIIKEIDLSAKFASKSFDVVHAHFGWMGLHALKLKDRGAFRAKLLTSFHGIDLNFDVKRTSYARLWQEGDYFTANTHFSLNRAVELGCPPELISTLPESVSIEKFRFQERRLQEGESVRILSVARLTEAKGLHLSIPAIAKLVSEGIDIRYDIIGEGHYRAELEGMIQSLGLTDRVTLHGALPHEQVRAQFEKAHLFLLPSIRHKTGMEGQGVVIQEAQAAGLPVAVSNTLGIPEGLLDGQTGRLFPEGDTEAMATVLRELIGNHERWPEMGRSGRQFVEGKYDADVLNQQLEETYLRMCSSEPAVAQVR